MLVSWKWLNDYVDLSMSPNDAATRLMMAGLNHECTEPIADDFCIDLEITNNRPDCLGHIGIAREIAVMYGKQLNIPAANPAAAATTDTPAKVTIEASELCPRYTARVIHGVKIGPSPVWLVQRLRTVGITSINNVVDVTNYVLMECGQPLHAFDLNRLHGQQIIVRPAAEGETLEAINHQTYKLAAGMCVIADAKRPLALAGVMGGAATEVTDTTTDLLIEAAEFSQLSTRATARALKLHSPSSYRFERGVDPVTVDWASRRCCELILQLAGGKLSSHTVDVGRQPRLAPPIKFRLSQIERVLGIAIDRDRVVQILANLGLKISEQGEATLTVTPPSWRRDLSREIDLIEEVARIHGYDKIPETCAVPMAASHRANADRVLGIVRRVMTSAGFDEAMTTSVVTPETSALFSPWVEAEPLCTNQPMLKGTDRIRRSLIPSLLEARETNEARGNAVIELFETAKVYLPGSSPLPEERMMLSAVSGNDFYLLKGVVEAIVASLNPSLSLRVSTVSLALLEAGKSVQLHVNQHVLGYLGVVSALGRRSLRLRNSATAFEIELGVLERIAQLVPLYQASSLFPAIVRDLNLVLSDEVRWADLESTIIAAAGDTLENVQYLDTYRAVDKDGAGTKRILFAMTLRRSQRTLTGEEADAISSSVVAACATVHGARMLA